MIAGAARPAVREAASAAYWVGLNDVACPSAKSCFATGYVSYGTSNIRTPLLERWNGHRRPAHRGRVPLVRRRAQRRHLEGDGADPGAKGDEYLDAVTCASAIDCLATGATEAEVPYALSGIAYAEAWSGKARTVKKVPTLPGAEGPGTAQGSSLDSATCVTASYCLAVGTAGVHLQGVSGVWTGKAWKQLSVAAS